MYRTAAVKTEEKQPNPSIFSFSIRVTSIIAPLPEQWSYTELTQGQKSISQAPVCGDIIKGSRC